MTVVIHVMISNGDRSSQKYVFALTDFFHIIPDEALNRIRALTIYYDVKIMGFNFFYNNNGGRILR